MTRIRRNNPAWRRLMDRLSGPWVTDAPAGHLGSLDVANGMGECPPMTDDQAARPMADLARGCPVCSWVPPHPRFRVLTHLPDGAHYSRSMDAPDVPVYDQETPLASEVEAWLAGGAR